MIHRGDLFDVLPTLAENSVDACVTDPPYGIGFMGKEWDSFKPGKGEARILPNRAIESDNPNLKGRTRGPASSPSAVEYDRSVKGQREFQAWSERWGREVLRVLKPGAYVLVCGAPRCYHRMACGLEDAGFVVRDCLSWLYGQGFPKSLNLGNGKGTALKPGWEPIVLAWKPFKGTTTDCHAKHGTAALNIDACRLAFSGPEDAAAAAAAQRTSHNGLQGTSTFARTGDVQKSIDGYLGRMDLGRWPANVLLDEEAAAMLDEQTGELISGQPCGIKAGGQGNAFGHYEGGIPVTGFGDNGGASRFYYVAKPSREERDYGTRGMPKQDNCDISGRTPGGAGLNSPLAGAMRTSAAGNFHPTVKPVELMRWLVKLVTPPGGTVLDPFMGSGTTGMACQYEQRQFIGIEREAGYVQIAERRIAAVAPLFAERVV